jgi:hypothetical protein
VSGALGKATVKKNGQGDYVVRTNLPPDKLSDLSVMVFSAWLKFAMGRDTLGGRMLLHPTGKYASSLRYQANPSANTIAIFADDSVAPEASILETGHKLFDLKTKFQSGRAYPMHRDGPGAPSGSPAIWAERRNGSFNGLSRVGGSGWILPAMMAYAPAKILADLAAQAARMNNR